MGKDAPNLADERGSSPADQQVATRGQLPAREAKGPARRQSAGGRASVLPRRRGRPSKWAEAQVLGEMIRFECDNVRTAQNKLYMLRAIEAIGCAPEHAWLGLGSVAAMRSGTNKLRGTVLYELGRFGTAEEMQRMALHLHHNGIRNVRQAVAYLRSVRLASDGIGKDFDNTLSAVHEFAGSLRRQNHAWSDMALAFEQMAALCRERSKSVINSRLEREVRREMDQQLGAC